MSDESTPTPVPCSFCGKDMRAVSKMIASDGAYICNECVALCLEMITDEIAEERAPVRRPFRIAVRHPDGATAEVEVEHRDGFALAGWCWQCGTLLAGYDITACVHCGAPLGKQPARPS